MKTSQEKVINRWLVVIGAVLIQLCLGAIYAWSVFTPYLAGNSQDPVTKFGGVIFSINPQFQSDLDSNLISDNLKQELQKNGVSLSEKTTIKVKKAGERWQIQIEDIDKGKKIYNLKKDENISVYTGFTKTQTQIVFSVGLAAFALVMVFAGKWQAKTGPRKVAMIGGILLGLGYILAGLLGQSFITQVIFIGIIGGAGIGFAYVCPISVGMKWFPDKKGLITGLAVAGFGFGALIWVKLGDNWGHLLENFGVLRVFLIYGIVFAVAVLVGSIWMVNPPEGWKPAGWNPPQPKKGKSASKVDFNASEMLRRPQFYGLWIMFIFSGMAGLMTIGIIKLFGIEALQGRGGYDAQQASAIAGTAMAVFYSLANGLGRIIWGTLSDKIGRKISLFLMCLIQGIMMLLFYAMGANQYLLYLGAALIGFNFGGNFALFPTATADFFGTKNVGQNYPWVFTAYGIGGIIGPIMAGSIRDIVGGWLPAFIISGVACLIAAGIAISLKPPKELASATK